MLPYLFYCPQNILLGPIDTLANPFVTFQVGNCIFPDSSVVIFQNPTVTKTNQPPKTLITYPESKNENFQSKRSKQARKISKSHQRKKARSHSHQNEIRNIFSNIARLVINFVALESKSKTYLLQMLKRELFQIKQSYISQFYKEAVSSKKQIKTVYLSKSTFYEFLGLISKNSTLMEKSYQTNEESRMKRIFRRLAYFYIHSILPKQIIHSKKINPNLKEGHLKTGKEVLRLLRLAETV